MQKTLAGNVLFLTISMISRTLPFYIVKIRQRFQRTNYKSV